MTIRMTTFADTAINLATAPLTAGFSGVLVNFAAMTDIDVEGSDAEDGTYAPVATVPAVGMIEVTDLPPWIRATSAADIWLLADL